MYGRFDIDHESHRDILKFVFQTRIYQKESLINDTFIGHIELPFDDLKISTYPIKV